MRKIATTIDELELEVQYDASAADDGLENLAKTLERIKASTANIGLGRVSKQLETIIKPLSQLNSSHASNLDKLAGSLSALSNVGNFKLSSSIATQVEAIGKAARSLNGANFYPLRQLPGVLQPLGTIEKVNLKSFITQLPQMKTAIEDFNEADLGSLGPNITNLVSALAPLSSMGKNGLTSYVNSMKKLPDAMDAVEKALSTGNLKGQIQDLADAFKPLAAEMDKVAKGFSAMPDKIQKVIKSTKDLSKNGGTNLSSFVSRAKDILLVAGWFRAGWKTLGGFLERSNDYIESMNLFKVTMGEFAEEEYKFAIKVQDLLGVDPAEWLRAEGIFMALASGFGVASDNAVKMSRNLTQLIYDISSFFNLPVEEAMKKVQSAISGELEPVRNIGYDLSQAALKEIALDSSNYADSLENVANALSDVSMEQFTATEGYRKSFNDMTQAEKSQLRYIAMMKQLTIVQGDLGRTAMSPANQLRILKSQIEQCARAIGNLFIPILQAVVPPLIALAKVVRMVLDLFAKLFGIGEIADFTDAMGSVGSAADGGANLEDSLGGASKKAKEIKNALLGIDELNIISPKEDTSGAGNENGAAGGGLSFNLPEYDFFKELAESKIQPIIDKMKEWLGINKEINSFGELMDTNLGKILKTVTMIGAGFAAWKIGNGIIKFLELAKGFELPGGLAALGLAKLVDDLSRFVDYIVDFLDNGPNLENVSGMLSEFAGAIGDVMLLLGKTKIAGALFVVQGVLGIISSIASIAENGWNWSDVGNIIRNLGNIALGIGVFTGNLGLAGAGLAINGLMGLIDDVKDIIEKVKEGKWDEIDWAPKVTHAIMFVGGLILTFGYLKTVKEKTGPIKEAADAIKAVTTTTETVSQHTNTLGPKLSDLAKNLALGVAIIAEVAAAAIIIVGAIAVLGFELGAVGKAWEPVITDSEYVIAGMLTGTLMLVTIGLVAAGIGKSGKQLVVDMGVGTAILLEVGVAAGLFVAEIILLGIGLQKIATEWQPVLQNGETITNAIVLGTALLVGIGVVTAALGAATVASAGTLPIAIGIGTALLVALSEAFVLFVDELAKVADQLSNRLSPALIDLNGKLPELKQNMSDFVDFMQDFVGEVIRYNEASVSAGFSAVFTNFVNFFAGDPVTNMSNTVESTGTQVATLNGKLQTANPELETAIGLLSDYTAYLDKLKEIAAQDEESKEMFSLSDGLKVNLNNVGQAIVTGFSDGIQLKLPELQAAITTWGTNVQAWFKTTGQGGVNATTFKGFATDIIVGFKNEIDSFRINSKKSMTDWAQNVRDWFTKNEFGSVNEKTFKGYAEDAVSGFKQGILSKKKDALSEVSEMGKNICTKIEKPFGDGTTLKDKFESIGVNAMQGLIDGMKSKKEELEELCEEIGDLAAQATSDALGIASPSKVFKKIGAYTVEGFNIGAKSMMNDSYNVMDNWSNKLSGYSPTMSFAVDTSALKYYSSDSFSKGVSAEFSNTGSYSVSGFKEGMEEFYHEYMQPTLEQMAEDMRRQADKSEKTVVQIGNRVVHDVVKEQQKINGYSFVK